MPCNGKGYDPTCPKCVELDAKLRQVLEAVKERQAAREVVLIDSLGLGINLFKDKKSKR